MAGERYKGAESTKKGEQGGSVKVAQITPWIRVKGREGEHTIFVCFVEVKSRGKPGAL